MTQWKKGDWVRCGCSGDGEGCAVWGMVVRDGSSDGQMAVVGPPHPDFNDRVNIHGVWWEQYLLPEHAIRKRGRHDLYKLALMKSVMRGEIEI